METCKLLRLFCPLLCSSFRFPRPGLSVAPQKKLSRGPNLREREGVRERGEWLLIAPQKQMKKKTVITVRSRRHETLRLRFCEPGTRLASSELGERLQEFRNSESVFSQLRQAMCFVCTCTRRLPGTGFITLMTL